MNKHDCEQDERVRMIERRVDRIEERIEGNKTMFDRDIKNLAELIQSMKSFQNKLTWWIISLFGTSIVTLLTIISKK
jgi:uncharacterized protein YaaN involved in tellurite resistance